MTLFLRSLSVSLIVLFSPAALASAQSAPRFEGASELDAPAAPARSSLPKEPLRSPYPRVRFGVTGAPGFGLHGDATGFAWSGVLRFGLQLDEHVGFYLQPGASAMLADGLQVGANVSAIVDFTYGSFRVGFGPSIGYWQTESYGLQPFGGFAGVSMHAGWLVGRDAPPQRRHVFSVGPRVEVIPSGNATLVFATLELGYEMF